MARSTGRGASGGGDGEARYDTLLHNMSEGFALCEAIRDDTGRLVDYRLKYANPVFVDRAPPGQAVVNRRQLETRPSTGPAWFAACDRALAGKPVRFEFKDPLTARWYEVHMMRMSEEELGQLFVDVTARKAAEERQAELFLELNHRVKNNLAIVSAMLRLQARAGPAEVREHLGKAIDRIQSIAELHAALYQQNSVDRVDLCPYLSDLAERLSGALLARTAVRLDVSCDHAVVSSAEAVNIGLIVNGLVTNAAKHAFPDRTDGRIEVVLTRNGPDRLRLKVRDDGVGFREAAGRRTGSLGLRFVSSLVQSLGGAMTKGDGPGAQFEFDLPVLLASDHPDPQPRLI